MPWVSRPVGARAWRWLSGCGTANHRLICGRSISVASVRITVPIDSLVRECWKGRAIIMRCTGRISSFKPAGRCAVARYTTACKRAGRVSAVRRAGNGPTGLQETVNLPWTTTPSGSRTGMTPSVSNTGPAVSAWRFSISRVLSNYWSPDWMRSPCCSVSAPPMWPFLPVRCAMHQCSIVTGA